MAAADGSHRGRRGNAKPVHAFVRALAYGFAFREQIPTARLTLCRRGLVIAQDSGNRFTEPNWRSVLARLEAEHGDSRAAFDHLGLAIRNMHDSGNITTMRRPLGCPRRSCSTGSGATKPSATSPVSRSVRSPR